MYNKNLKKIDMQKIQKKTSTVKLGISNQKSSKKLVTKKSREQYITKSEQKQTTMYKPYKEKKTESFKEKSNYKKFLKNKFKEFNNNGKITVVFFCDTFYPIIDGVIRVMDNYMMRLSKEYNVVACVPKHKGKTFKSDKYVVVGVNSMNLGALGYDLALPYLDTDFQNIIKNLRIDIIHSHSPFYMGGFAVKLAKKLKIPIVTTFHSQYKKDFFQATKSEMLTNLLLKNIMKRFNQSTEVWTMNKKTLATLKSYGYKGKYFFVPNATNMTYPENPSYLLDLVNKKYNVENSENILLFVGRLVEQKNILFITDALKILKEKSIPFKMIFVGSGPDEDKLKEKIKENKLENDVILTGKLSVGGSDEQLLQGLYLRADLFLFPSMYDTSSLVQIEAATNKTPTLFIKGSVTSGDVEDNHNGFLSGKSVNEYANKIVDILSDKEKLKQVSEQCYNDLYVTWDKVVNKVSDRYKYLNEQNNSNKSIKRAFKYLKKNSVIIKKINKIKKDS